MKRAILAFASDARGATALEYGLIIALISIAILAAAIALGGSLIGVWDGVAVEAAK